MTDAQFAIEIKEINAEQLEEILVQNAKTFGINARIFDGFDIGGKVRYFESSKSELYNNGEGYVGTRIILRKGGVSFAEINFNKKRITEPLKVGMSIYQNQNVFNENELAKYLKTIEHLT
ncbi:MAG: hypothetical protein KKE93_01950 [Nanoarchaeota archaeon]|nr:hypothetical protein [Nanoarchaeota archaeon]